MFAYRRIRRKQILREAEGYLELATAFADRWPLPADLRDQVVQRALDVLARLSSNSGCKAAVSHLRGQALRIMERYRLAIEHLETAAELDPENTHTWLALGWCYKRTGRLDLAIQSLEEALAIDASQAIVYYNLACYWSLANNTKHALAYLTRAFQLDPSYRDMVPEEPDFDPIRSHPGFQELTGVIV